MTTEQQKLFAAFEHRLAVLEAEVAALKTARCRELTLEERVDGAMMLPRTGTGGVLLVSDKERA